MGAFQIDKMLREGDLKGVFEKVRKQMMQQFGHIVSLDEATKSPAAAAQLTRQVAILKQGPLGQFAKSDQDAYRILEGFKAGKVGGGEKALKENIVQDGMGKGLDIEQKSYTELSRIRSLIEEARGMASVGDLGIIQEAATAGVGKEVPGTVSGSVMRKDLASHMRERASDSGKVTDRFSAGLNGASIEDESGTAIASSIMGYKKLFSELNVTFKSHMETMRRMILGGASQEDTDAQMAALQKEINEKRKAAETLTGDKRKKELDYLSEQEAIAKKAQQTLAITGGRMSVPTVSKMPSPDHYYTEASLTPPGSRVGAAAKASTSRKPTTVTGTGTHTSSTSTAAPAATDHPRVDLHVTAICEHCKQKLETKQLTATSVAAGSHSG